MSKLIASTNQCVENLLQIKTAIEQSKQNGMDDPNSIWDGLRDYSSLLGMASQTCASLEYHVSRKRIEMINKVKNEKIPASIMKDLIDAECKDLISIHNMAVSFHRDLEKICDSYRSMLSFLKQDMVKSSFTHS